MLELEPDDELALIIETAHKFADEALVPQLREAEANRCVATSVRALHEEIGLAGLELPEALGGAELGMVARVLVNEELAAGDPGAAIALDALGAALYPVHALGGERALGELQSLLEDRGPGGRACLVFEEDAHFAIAGDRVTAFLPWLPADRVDALVYLTRSGAVLVTEGIEATPVRGAGLRAAGAAEIHLDGAPITQRWSDPEAATRARAQVRVANASLLLGVLRHSCEFSRAYARERHAFGRPIAHHQALAFMITDMQMALDGARLLVHEAAWMLDAELPATIQAASAYAQCIESARFIGPAGVQILGGHGFMADYPMEKAMREARALGLLYGGIDTAIEESGAALCEAGTPVALGVLQRESRAGSA